MATYTFETPTLEEGISVLGMPRLLDFYRLTRSYTVINQSGVYSLTRYPAQDNLESYTAYYMGGTKNSVSQSVKDAMIAASIGITEANFTAE